MTGDRATVRFQPGKASLADLRALAINGAELGFSGRWRRAVQKAAAYIADAVASGRVLYGVNTGFGSLARTTIAADRLQRLQVNLIRSHCAGVGEPLEDAVVRLVLALKANSLALGYSGVREEIVDLLIGMANAGVLPVVPRQGSVGASGDLAPLAHLAAVLIGEGQARVGGRPLNGGSALQRRGLTPIELKPKEGLALLNGTQVSTALALNALFELEDVFHAALIAGALATDAASGSDTPFDPRIQKIRGHPGGIVTAAIYREMMAGSDIRNSHIDCDRVQDPYSLRCQPQVMGACLELIRHGAGILHREANAVSDNPLVFAADGEVLSGGNFHAEPVAFAADILALAIAEIGSMSERRIALLVDTQMSGLPPFLTVEAGVNSGYMIAQVTAAALAAENKSRSVPGSVESLPTSANQEDHVSMATFAAYRLGPMVRNLRHVVAIEMLAAADGIAFHAPTETSRLLGEVVARIREVAPRRVADRPFKPDIEAVAGLIRSGAFADMPGREMLPSAA